MGDKTMGEIVIRNYCGEIIGIIDKYPQFTVTNDVRKQELRLMNNRKLEENMEFESFAEFEEYMKNRKDDEK